MDAVKLVKWAQVQTLVDKIKALIHRERSELEARIIVLENEVEELRNLVYKDEWQGVRKWKDEYIWKYDNKPSGDSDFSTDFNSDFGA